MRPAPPSPVPAPVPVRLRLLLDHLWGDLRHATRSLARSPIFAVVAVLSLAFGIGCATVFFSAVNAILLRPQPLHRDPERLVAIGSGVAYNPWGPLSYPELVDVRAGVPALSGVAAVGSRSLTLSEPDGPERTLEGEAVSEGYFEVLGVTFPLGRAFSNEDAASGWRVAILGHHTWERDFGGNPSVLGRAIRLDGQDHTIVGVAPARLQAWRQPSPADVWVPIEPTRRARRGHCAFQLVGRMRPGVTVALVQDQLDRVAGRLAEEHPAMWRDRGGNLRRFQALSESASRVEPDHRPTVLGAGAMVTALLVVLLLVSCTNVATLLLGRAAARERETAVRLALGASRGRMLQQLLAETAVLSGLAGAAAVLVTHWSTRLLASGGGPLGLPIGLDFTLDVRVVVFAVGLALATVVVAGLAPALRASRPALVPALQGTRPPDPWRFGLRSALVAAQVAGAGVLVVMTALLLRSLDATRRVDLGFDRENVALLSIDLSHRQYAASEGRAALDQLVERVSSLAGVQAVALARTVPLGPIRMYLDARPEAAQAADWEGEPPSGNAVSPGFFELLGIPVVRGRGFSPIDREGSTPVAVVNQALAERWWPGEDPLGRRIEGERPAEVIGVVADARLNDPTERPRPAVWYPSSQWYTHESTVMVRTSSDPRPLFPSLREQLRAVDPQLPVVSLDLLEQLETDADRSRSVVPMLLAVLGSLCLGMAALGIYGVVSHSVAQRTREIGVRLAMGAHPRAVVATVVSQALELAGVGLAAGLALAVVAAFAMRSMLFGVGPLDPASIGLGVVVVLATAVSAGAIPALRASRVDPVEALRSE